MPDANAEETPKKETAETPAKSSAISKLLLIVVIALVSSAGGGSVASDGSLDCSVPTGTAGAIPLSGATVATAAKPGISSRFKRRLMRISIRVSSPPSSVVTKV